MKYRLNEQQLNNLISESTMRILSEAMEDEGIGKFLGDMAGRIRNGINKFSSDFNAARNNRLYQNRNYDSYQNYGYDPNSRNFDPNTARQYQDTKNAGASRTAMGSFQTQYGDTVPGAQPQGNPQTEPQNTQQTTPPSTPQNGPQYNPQMQQNQNVDYEKINQLANQSDAALRACKAKGLTMEKDGNNRIFKTKDGSPRNQEQNQLVQAYKQAYNAWMDARGSKNRLNISESKLNNIIRESVRKVLKEANNGVVTLGNPEDGRGYHVTIAGDSLGPYAEFDVYGVGTDAQAAVDYAVDYLEKNGETGYFWDDDEMAEEYPDDFFYAGNCGHILRSDLVHINQIG